MAKRVPFKTFATQIIKHYGEGPLTRGQLRTFAADKGWQVPSEAWSYKADRGLFDIKPPQAVKINLNEKDSSEVAEKFEDMRSLTEVVVKGFRPSLIITGNAGIGKTYEVTDVLSKNYLIQGRDYAFVKGKSSPYGLYVTLFLNRDKIVVFDDCDAIFKNDDSTNILKAALDSYSKRVISWSSKSTINVSKMSEPEKEVIAEMALDGILAGDDSVKLPSEFEFTGRVIFISNLQREQMEGAILSRSLNIDMTLTDSEVFERIHQVLDGMEGSKEVKEQVVASLIKSYESGAISLPTLRSVANSVGILSSGVKNAERLLSYC